MSRDELMTGYARLAVRIGVNLQPGQSLCVNCLPEHAPFARVVAAEAYAAGARYVDVHYLDQRVRAAQAEHGPEESLGWSPPWLVQRLTDLAADGGALLTISGNPDPGAFAGLDGARVARTRMPEVTEANLRLVDGQCNWSFVAFPTAGWARTVLGEPDVDRLWAAVATAVRLDEPDPVAAWRDHIARLGRRADALNERRFDALRYRGPRTDLTVGLHPDSIWMAARDLTRGIEHIPNMPTEEVFTTPDARRAEGVVSATYPLELAGTLVRGLSVRFQGGRVTELRAEEGEDVLRAHIAADDGASRLGEVALVDSSSRVGQTGLVFYNTLFDENAASHIAFGEGSVQTVTRARSLTPAERHSEGINHSTVHTDFMIGSSELEVNGVSADGREVPILDSGSWALR